MTEERRLVFLRYSASPVLPSVYVDVRGSEVTVQPDDVVLPEDEKTYETLSKVYEQVQEEDLVEVQGANDLSLMS
jgi:hypothetical protein